MWEPSRPTLHSRGRPRKKRGRFARPTGSQTVLIPRSRQETSRERRWTRNHFVTGVRRGRPRPQAYYASYLRNLVWFGMPRPSHVRSAIDRLLCTSDRHDWSADSVLEALQAEGIGADFSSVCRGLTHLERAGTLRRVNLGDGKARYEAARGHHDHVQCESCGTVAEVPGCAVESAHERIESTTGYVLTGHSLVFSGLCGECIRGGT